jgi:hypothetical protein
VARPPVHKVKDTLESVISKLVEAKVKYEKSLFFVDSTQSTLRKEYFSRTKRFKQHKTLYIKYIKSRLKNGFLNKNIIQFSYIAPYDSSIPPCTFLENSKLLKILLYNLEAVESDTTLICNKEMLK